MVHKYNRKLLSHKKEWNNAICTNTDGPKDYYTKWSKPARERQIPYDITHMWNLKTGHKWTDLQNRNRLTYLENKIMVIKGEKCGGYTLGAWY